MSSRFFTLFFLFIFFLFLFTVPSHAQGGPSPSFSTSDTNPVQDFIDSLLSFIFKRSIKPYTQASTPINSSNVTEAAGNPSVKGESTSSIRTETAKYYGIVRSVKGPFESKATDDWFLGILNSIGIDAEGFSKQAGRDFVNSILPGQSECNQETCFREAQCGVLPPNEGCLEDKAVVFEGQPTESPKK